MLTNVFVFFSLQQCYQGYEPLPYVCLGLIYLHISSHSLQSHTQTFWFFCLLILHNQRCAFAACSWKKNCQQCTLGRTVRIGYCGHATCVPRPYAVHHYHKPLFPFPSITPIHLAHVSVDIKMLGTVVFPCMPHVI